MTGAEFSGGFSSSFGTAGVVDSVIGMLYKHGKDVTVNPQQGVTVRHGPYPVGPTLHPTSTWKNTESGSYTSVYISKDRNSRVKSVRHVGAGTPVEKRAGKWQSQGEANADGYFDKHKTAAKYWTVVPFKVSWDVMIVRWEYVDGVLSEFQGALEASCQRIAALQQKAKSFGAGSEGLAKIEVEIGRIQQQMFKTRGEMRGILAFRGMFEGVVVVFGCRVTALSSWGRWKLNAPQNCSVKMSFDIRPHEKNGKTGMSIQIKWDERMPGWSRVKLGKLEIQGGKFKSFSGEIASVCKNFEKTSDPVKTYAEATPTPSTATMKADYENSASWQYLSQVAAGLDPDISGQKAKQAIRVKVGSPVSPGTPAAAVGSPGPSGIQPTAASTSGGPAPTSTTADTASGSRRRRSSPSNVRTPPSPEEGRTRTAFRMPGGPVSFNPETSEIPVASPQEGRPGRRPTSGQTRRRQST